MFHFVKGSCFPWSLVAFTPKHANIRIRQWHSKTNKLTNNIVKTDEYHVHNKCLLLELVQTVMTYEQPHPFNLLFFAVAEFLTYNITSVNQFSPGSLSFQNFLPSLSSPKLPHPIFLPTLKLGPTIMGPAELPVLFCILRALALCFLPDLDASSYSLWECILFPSCLYVISDYLTSYCM